MSAETGPGSPLTSAEREAPSGGKPSAVERRASALIRRVFALGFAGIIVGTVVGGLGGRIVMRISAIAAGDALQGIRTEAGNRVGEITLGGTIALIIFGGALSGAAAAIVVVAARPWLPQRRGLRGISLGLFLLAVAGSFIIDADNFDFMILDPPLLNIGMFAGLFLLFGLLVLPLADRVERRLGIRESGGSAYGLLPFVLLGAVLMIPVYGSFFFEGFCECDDPAVAVGLFAVVGSLATVLSWVEKVRHGKEAQLGIVVLGLAGVVGAFVFGSMRLADEIQRIL